MAGTGGGGSGSKGGDNNAERLRKMVADHLRASGLSAVDTRTPEGKATEAKATEKKKKRDERATIGAFSPRSLEKKRRKDERDAIRKAKLDLKKKEEERKKHSSDIRSIRFKHTPRQLKEVTEQLAKAKKAREFGRSNYDLKALELKDAECQSVVDEVGDPPLKFLKAAERVKLVPNTTHKLGQGGIPGLKAAFYRRYKRKITAAEMNMGQEHGKEHLFAHVDALLASEGESESS
ncbi:unnamed protein product [Sphagnum troendelagicum]|uniref:Ribosome biogenesis protein NOP53 n=1 Tax=Sphagnum troendelagicum TaxID=128251 RepID=A0ABP0TCE4_9BRYO